MKRRKDKGENLINDDYIESFWYLLKEIFFIGFGRKNLKVQ